MKNYTGFVNDITNTLGAGDYNPAAVAITGGTISGVTKMAWAAATELTLASDAVTVTQALHLIDTQADAASDDLATINGGADGQLLAIRAAHTDRTVVVKETGNIYSGGADITLDDTKKYLLFVYDLALTKWVVIGGSAAAVDLTAPGPIGGTTPSTGAFTGLTLSDAGKITWDIAPASDHTCTGNIASLTAGEALTYGQCCYLKSDGKWYNALNTGSSTMPAMAIVADAAGISAAANGNFLIGWTEVIRDDSWDWVIGAPIYVSGTAGEFTQTVPATNFSQVQVMGFALTADVIALFPVPILVEVGLDIEAKDTGYAITWAELTSQVKTFTTDAATDQAYSLSSVPTSADVGKQFRISNVNATPGKLTLTLPTGVTCDNLSTAGGTVYWTGGNVTFELMTATVMQIVSANAVVSYT